MRQAEKDAVPEHVKKAAREMGQKAFKQRLREIHMSEYDAQLYNQFSDAVSRQVHAFSITSYIFISEYNVHLYDSFLLLLADWYVHFLFFIQFL